MPYIYIRYHCNSPNKDEVTMRKIEVCSFGYIKFRVKFSSLIDFFSEKKKKN